MEAPVGAGGHRLREQQQLRQQGFPRVSGSFLLWRGNDAFSGTRLHAGYAEGIKEPSFEQSFGIAGNFSRDAQSEPASRNKTTPSKPAFDQSFLSNRLTLSALYFHNSFLDQIEFLFNDIDFTSQYVNFNKSMAQGAEVVVSGRINNHLSINAAYTYTSTQIQDAPPCDPAAGCDPLIYGIGAPLLRRPKQAGTFSPPTRGMTGEPAPV